MSSLSVLRLTLGFFLYTAVFAFDPCLSGNHQRLDQSDRSTAVILTSISNGRSDAALQKGWYAFVSGAGKEIPTTAPLPNTCGTVYPIWLNGTQPPQDGLVHDLDMCYVLSKFDSCGIKLKIQGKMCLRNPVYYLVPTSSNNGHIQISNAAYCAGEEAACPPGQSSLTGFTPGCYRAPKMMKKPVLSIEEYENDFVFRCNFIADLNNTAYELLWYADNDLIHQEEMQIGQTEASLKDHQLIHQGQSLLGCNLTCSVRGRYLDQPTNKWGAQLASKPYYVGIEVTDMSGMALHLQSWKLNLPENEDMQALRIRSTIPLKCSARVKSSRQCKLEIAIQNDDSSDLRPLLCKKKKVQQLKIATCAVTITPENWAIPQTIAIRATRDFKYDGSRTRVIEFEMVEVPGFSVWDGYIPNAIEVTTQDFIDKNSYCSSLNDPHMKSFDGFKYHNHYEGEFILYRHTELPFEVRGFYKRCNSFATCNCAVAARVGDDVIIIDRCNSMGDIKIWGSDKKVEYNLLRTRSISSHDDILSPGFKIYTKRGGREYEIILPNGAKVRAQVYSGHKAQFINIWVYPAPSDFNKTQGLCGTFDGNVNNDLIFANGSLFTGPGSRVNQQPKPFSLHWRVTGEDSLYNANVNPRENTYEKRYCSCVKGHKFEEAYLDCSMNSDVSRCDISGDDITGKNFEYRTPKGQSKKGKNWNNKWAEKLNKFDYEADWEPKTPSWPTPGGWTRKSAEKFCKDKLMNTDAFKICNMTITDEVDMCMEDILLSDSTEWAMTAVEAFKDKCRTELEKEEPSSIPDVFCLNECSYKGKCVNNLCVCDAGFSGEDCSLKDDVTPSAYFTPFCDIFTEDCDSPAVYGTGFLNNKELVCTYESAEVKDGILVSMGPKQQVSANYESFGEVSCPLYNSRIKKSVSSKSTASRLMLTVSNNRGQSTSNVVFYVEYDSRCQECNVTSGQCVTKENSCHIEGSCYQQGDYNPKGRAHGRCDPKVTRSSWSQVEEVFPDWAIAVITSMATLIVTGTGIFTYLKCRKSHKILNA